MTSEAVYVWISLPDDTRPTLAGRLVVDADGGRFVYGRRYRGNPAAVPFDSVELPLVPGEHLVAPDRNGGLPGVIRDASPDSWGRYVLGAHRQDGLSEVALLLRSPDDRVGALSFSLGSDAAPATTTPAPTLQAVEALAEASLRQQQERLSTPDTASGPSRRTRAVIGDPRTSLGGARPKLTVMEDGALWLAKINKPDDPFDIARTEAAMLDLARSCGIETPDASVRRFGRHDALLVRRFDREVRPDGGVERVGFASALTCFVADESDRTVGSYPALADLLRRFGRLADGPELFRRMVFNALIGNGDDHLRNHGVLAAGTGWRLSPAYDLVPQPTHSHEPRLAIGVGDAGREASVPNLLSRAGRFGLSTEEAKATIADMARIVAHRSEAALRDRGVPVGQIGYLRTAFLNPGLRLEETGSPVPEVI